MFINRVPGVGSNVAVSANRLTTTRIAGENLSALRLVKMVGPNTVVLADPSGPTDLDATVLGLTLNTALNGDSVVCLLLGAYADPSFTFAENATLYLGANGLLTATEPVVGFMTRVGWGLGSGEIFLSLENPIIL